MADQQELDRGQEIQAPSQEQLISFIKSLGESQDGLLNDLEALDAGDVKATFINSDHVKDADHYDSSFGRTSIDSSLGFDRIRGLRLGNFKQFVDIMGIISEAGGVLEKFSAKGGYSELSIDKKSLNLSFFVDNKNYTVDDDDFDEERAVKIKRQNVGKLGLIEKIKNGCCGKGIVKTDHSKQPDDEIYHTLQIKY